MRGSEQPRKANPLVDLILSGQAPLPLRQSAARGVLPLSRTDLVRMMIALSGDADEQVRKDAATRLASFPETEILSMLEDASASPELLDHFGRTAPGVPVLQAAVIANPATAPETLRRMAPLMTTAQIDQMLLNQTRLITAPDLLDLLDSNPALTPPQRSRVQEIRRHFLAAPPQQAEESAGASSAASAAAVEDEPRAEPETAAGISATPDPDVAVPSDSELASVIANAMQKIMRMNTADKMQLAMKGTREERAILIKDSSKVVQEAVLDSPKLTENEVEGFARMRSLSEDVIRVIAGNREWVKNYSVIQALASNPKTPTGLAMNMVTRLTNRDLKVLAGDKNVSEVIRRHARKISQSRTQRPGSQ